MKVVLLAAGEGKRISSAFHGPKGLLSLPGGETILGRLIRQLRPFFSASEICLVVGYEQEQIRNAHPSVSYVFNPQYAKENTSQSLLRAIREWEPEDLVWINGDVVCHETVLPSFLRTARSQIVVHQAKTGEEEVKYRTESNRVVQIGKDISGGEGESVGIQMVLKRDFSLLEECLEECSPEDYFEEALQKGIDKGMSVHPFLIEDDQAIEVDFPGDWQRSQMLVNNWASP